MFETIKTQVSLLEVITKDLDVTMIPVGSENFAIEDERAHGGCPFCSHNDCFRVKSLEDQPGNSIYKCFSCGEAGDVITWRSKHKELSLVDAAKDLAREYGIQLSNDYSPLQEIFTLAMQYYENCLWTECNRPYLELSRMTPQEYQKTVRQHDESTLKEWHIGWSDGGLIEYLEGIGYEEEMLLQSGLKNKKNGRDFLPSKCFIYPHFVKGRVSHFTFKDPLKKTAYQLPKKNSLNGYLVYGQDTISKSDTVLIVEGENDLLSVWGTNKVPAIVATIGQISGEQVEWMKEALADKNIITIFDADDAGDKYRIKIERIRKHFKKLAHVRPPNEKDIDDILKEGTDLEEFIFSHVVKVDVKSDPEAPKVVTAPWEETVSEEAKSFQEKLEANGLAVPTVRSEDVEPEEGIIEVEDSNIIQKKGVYWRITYKDGEPVYTKISDFTINLLNVFVDEDGERLREIVIVNQDGHTSKRFVVKSEAKVSLKSFKVLLANQNDATFSGKESDLEGMWKLIYDQSQKSIVEIPRQVGRHEGLGGWIFGNKYISDSGSVIDPDEDGIYWLQGHNIGIRPESLRVNSGKYENSDMPRTDTTMTVEEKDTFLKQVIEQLGTNRGDVGQALILLSWTQACIYSNTIFSMNGGFPFLFLWGMHGKGKTTIARWMQDFYDMKDKGYTSIPQIKSGVGLGRKVQYYSGLPLLIDEVRSNRETDEYLGMFRTYFDRTGRDLGVKDGFGVKTQQVRSCFMYVGEDQFEDPALRERCVSLRISPMDDRESYNWLRDNSYRFPGITFHWILESCSVNRELLKSEIEALDREFVANGCSNRVSKLWASISYFGIKLAEKYLPDFDFRSYVFKTCVGEASHQKSENTVAQFFELVEAIQANENSRITNSHIMLDGSQLHIWFPAVYKIVQDDRHGQFPFSKNAVLSALREEDYFVSSDKKITMGMDGARRVVVTLDVNDAPNSVKNIALSNNT
jgi:5S rRNA maturation endonuclease (ribonuclease M5)